MREEACAGRNVMTPGCEVEILTMRGEGSLKRISSRFLFIQQPRFGPQFSLSHEKSKPSSPLGQLRPVVLVVIRQLFFRTAQFQPWTGLWFFANDGAVLFDKGILSFGKPCTHSVFLLQIKSARNGLKFCMFTGNYHIRPEAGFAIWLILPILGLSH